MHRWQVGFRFKLVVDDRLIQADIEVDLCASSAQRGNWFKISESKLLKDYCRLAPNQKQVSSKRKLCGAESSFQASLR